MTRKAAIQRKTSETEIDLSLTLDGTGQYQIDTGIGFFDHMLALLAKHGLFDLTVEASGDLVVDYHHTVEDVGICLGQALNQALGDKAGIRRYGFMLLPMQEALAEVALDLSGRPHLVFDGDLPSQKTGDFDSELVREFFESLSTAALMNLHINVRRGANTHHVIEAIFKGFAKSLDMATSIDPRSSEVPSTKGTL